MSSSPDDRRVRLGSLLRSARAARGLTASAFADLAGISRDRYSLIEKGSALNVRPDTWGKLEDALGWDAGWCEAFLRDGIGPTGGIIDPIAGSGAALTAMRTVITNDATLIAEVAGELARTDDEELRAVLVAALRDWRLRRTGE